MHRVPARKLTKSSVKNIVRFPSIKANGGKSILVESLLESEFCFHLEFDPDIRTYFPQPRTFSVPGVSGFTRYTPDFEIHKHSGECLYAEVKPLERVMLESYQELFERFKAMLVGTNYSFVVIDEHQIRRAPLLSNYEKLYQFRKRPTLDMQNLYACSELMRCPVSLSCLIMTLGDRASLREIYTWLALGFLSFDIDNSLMSMDMEVQFNVS